MKSIYGKCELWQRALSPVHAVEEVEENSLKKCLNWFHVSCLGVGLILGAGAGPRQV
jgi:hypothetical protein